MGRFIGWVRRRETVIVPILLVSCAVFFGLLVAFYMTRSTVLTNDEMYYRRVMGYYADHGLNMQSLRGDVLSRGFARFYMLLYSPFFAHYDAYTAVRIGKFLNCLFFTSTALPTFLLARSVEISRWRALAAGLLSIAVPWVALTSSLMTESLCYPLLIWTTLFIFKSFHHPAWYWDFLVAICIALISTTRAQFLVLLPAYLLLIVVREIRIFRSRREDGFIKYFAHLLTRTPIAFLVFVVLAYYFVTGQALSVFNRVTGIYQGVATRKTTPVDMVISASFEVLAIALGTGLITIIIGGSWYWGLLSKRLQSRERDFATVVAVVVLVLFGFTLVAQGSYWGTRSEERYYFYIVPLLWIGVFGSLQQDVFLKRKTLLIAVFLVFCAALIQLNVALDGATMFITPVVAHAGYYLNAVLRHLSGWLNLASPLLSAQDLLGLAILFPVAFTLVCWKRSSLWLKQLSIVFAACTQFLFISAVFMTFSGHTGASATRIESTARLKKRAWVDRAGTEPKSVVWVNNDSLDPNFHRDIDQMFQLYWNRNVAGSLVVPQSLTDSVASWVAFLTLPQYSGKIMDGEEVLQVPDQSFSQLKFAVQDPDSPHFQLAGKRISLSDDGRFELIRMVKPVRTVWSSFGLSSSGFLPADHSSKLRFSPLTKSGYIVRFVFQNPGLESMRVGMRFGKWRKLIILSPKSVQAFSLKLCQSVDGEMKTIQPAQLPVPPPATGTAPSGPRVVATDIFPLRLNKKNGCLPLSSRKTIAEL